GLAAGLLTWYYGGMLSHRHANAANSGATAAVVTDSALPPLEPVTPVHAAPIPVPPPAQAPVDIPALQPAPLMASAPPPAVDVSQAPDRRLTGPAFAANSIAGAAAMAPGGAGSEPVADPADRTGTLAALLTPTALPAAQASVSPGQRLLLPKGAFIDCTLETAIDSSLPGMTTCITATDTFGADGKVVLLERGSKLIGETRGQVQQGSARLFVLWTEARTPTGVVVPLASPGTDALGRAGLDGEVDRHFWQRFGAAILISLVDGAVQAAQRSGGSGAAIYDGSSRDVATEALRGTIGIAPTITKHQGDRIQILVARDLDFRRVYQLRDSEASHQQ
ncbi:MAG TPA: type IV secretion system protein VirB10, partial [Steroidobacteraceae bacterium]|nr:type IV secretion system protein VirB10 [Steroidobacteraceae bacterium]